MIHGFGRVPALARPQLEGSVSLVQGSHPMPPRMAMSSSAPWGDDPRQQSHYTGKAMPMTRQPVAISLHKGLPAISRCGGQRDIHVGGPSTYLLKVSEWSGNQEPQEPRHPLPPHQAKAASRAARIMRRTRSCVWRALCRVTVLQMLDTCRPAWEALTDQSLLALLALDDWRMIGGPKRLDRGDFFSARRHQCQTQKNWADARDMGELDPSAFAPPSFSGEDRLGL